MTFIGVVVNDDDDDFDEFVTEHGVDGFDHLTSATDSDEIDQLIQEHDVTHVPTFVLIQGSGESRTQIGWDKSDLQDDLAWLETE